MHRWCAWDSDPQQQDGWHRRKHGAMAAAQTENSFKAILILDFLICFDKFHCLKNSLTSFYNIPTISFGW